MPTIPTRSFPHEEEGSKFTVADIRTSGKLSINLGRLHWQENVGDWSNQIAVLVKQQELLNDLVTSLLVREA